MATIILEPTTLTVPENTEAGYVVATLSIDGEIGENETFEFSVSDSSFEIKLNEETNEWELLVVTGDLFDFENDPVIDLTITATGSMQTEVAPASVAIDLTNVAEAPTDIIMTGGKVAENSLTGTPVAYLSAVDPENNISSYAFVTDETGSTPAANDYFEIDGATIRLKTGLDNAQVGAHDLWVKVTDKDGLSYVEKVTITVANSPEVFTGTSKNNKISGTADNDVINGLAGNDQLYGYDGDDLLSGGSGSDFIFGGNGNDILIGGSGKDKLSGGAGQDTFVFDALVKKGEFDQIDHFVSADDTIQISLSALKAFKVNGPKKNDQISKKASDTKKSVGFDKIFKKGKKLEKKFFDVGSKDNDADGSNDYIFYNKKNGKLFLDVDGSGKAKGIEILKVKPGTALGADDFLFI